MYFCSLRWKTGIASLTKQCYVTAPEQVSRKNVGINAYGHILFIWTDAALMFTAEPPRDDSPLSPRQHQILMLAGEGLTDRQIALHIGLSEGTVRTYWERIRGRLEARSRSEALARSLSGMYRSAMTELADLRIVVQGLTEFVWIAQPSGYVDYCNDWFERYSGRSVAEFIGRGCQLLMPEDQADASRARWELAQRTRSAYEAVVLFLDSHGIPRPHLIHLRPLLDEAGEVTRWIGTARPVGAATPSAG